MSKLEIKTAEINAQIAELQEQLQEATKAETLVVGATYNISVGRAETARVIPAVLMGQRTKDNGSVEFRFTHGEGFDARFYDLPYTKVVLDTPEGFVASATIAKNIARLETKLANLAETIAKQEALENLVDGQTYTIKVGKIGQLEEVAAVLLGQRESENGTKQYRFFYGQGFDSTVCTVSIRRVVLSTDSDVPATGDESVVEAEAAPSEPEAAPVVEVAEGTGSGAEYPSVFPQ